MNMAKVWLLLEFTPITLWIKNHSYVLTFDAEEKLLLIHAYIINEAFQQQYLGLIFFFHMFYFCYYKTWLDLLLWKITSITSGFTSVYLMSCCSFLSLYMKCCFEFMLPMKNLTIRFPQLHKALNNFVNIKYLRNHDTQYIISYWYTFGNCMQSTQSTPPLMPVSRGNNFKTYWTQLFCWR